MKLHRILRGGTTRAYSDITFNAKGDKLASVGSDPDYMLTVWNWKAQEITLKSKAFSQDVYKVAFAPENDGILTTSGMGHIKFWQMSATFTGLKLQGYLGKFGASELTDISAFVQLPDGKVLSSTETGNLLLWDGGMIKCEIAQKGKKPCHVGKIEVVLMMETEIFTAGEDGYVRVWDFETIDQADVTSETAGPGGAPVSSSGPAVARIFEMEFLEEFLIGKDVKIKNMIRNVDNNIINFTQYLILDQEGHLYKLDTKQRFVDKVLSFHSGGIAGLDMSPTCHAMVSLGADGSVHLYDYIKKALALDARGCTVAAGFMDGVLRIISYQPTPVDVSRPTFTLQYAFKPHKCPIAGIAIAPDGSYMATFGATDRTAFFFKIDNKPQSADENDRRGLPFDKNNVKLIPIGFIEMDESITNISFSSDNHTQSIEPNEDPEEEESDEEDEEEEGNGVFDGKLILIVCKDGGLYSARVPHPSRVNTSLTYQLDLVNLRVDQWKLNVPVPKVVEEKKPKEGEEDVEEKPASAGGDKKDAAPPVEPAKDDKGDKRIVSAIRKARGLCITETSAISRVFYLQGGYFLMAIVNKFGEGEIRSCKIDSPEKSRLILVAKSGFTDLKLTHSGKYLIAGTSDGLTCIRQIKLDEMLLHKWTGGHETYEQYSKAFDDFAQMVRAQKGISTAGPFPRDKIYDGQFWMGHVHDCDRGRITNVAVSFDEAFMCSSGADGGIFMFRFTPKEVQEKEAPNFDFYEADEQIPTQDIIDKAVYTIQETKIKSERDREIFEAEQKKQATRDYISELRSEYLKLVATMDAANIPRSSI
ncbi:Cilia- and flagella-associated protein 44, partial [Rhizoclosmatium hyalinum]